MMQIMVAILAVCCTILSVQVWQLREQFNQQQNELKDFKVAVSGELHVHLQAIKNEGAQRQSEYDILYKKVLKNGEDARKILSLLIDTTKHVAAMKDKYEIDVARLDENVDAIEKKVNELIGENQRKVNNSIRGLAELFVNEITELAAKLENETSLIHEKLKQLEAILREQVMIENNVHFETECYHHHHQVVEFREPQLTLGERIGQIIGGAVQSSATFLASKAMGVIGI
jgi:uncharacterized lipoprotein YehR (DUF1307 family)